MTAGTGAGAAGSAPGARNDGGTPEERGAVAAEAPPTRRENASRAVPLVPDRLYGRRQGHPLRARQQRLLDAALPRLSLDDAAAADPTAAFPIRPAELWLEIGFGGGEHTEVLARENPGTGLIAAEVFHNGICSLLSRLVPEGAENTAPGLPNLRLWSRDARHLLRLLPEASLSRLFLMFPDPWPKSRHSKRRFVHPATLPLVARALRPGGEWRIASDDPTYQRWVEEVFAGQDLFAPLLDAGERPEGWPGTRYESKALRAGRAPRYWIWRRR